MGRRNKKQSHKYKHKNKPSKRHKNQVQSGSDQTNGGQACGSHGASADTARRLRFQDYREYQLAKWARPDDIQDGVAMLLRMPDKRFDIFMKYLSKEGSYHFMCAALSIWLPFQDFNDELLKIREDVMNRDSFKLAEDVNPEICYIEVLAEISRIKVCKDRLYQLSYELRHHELSYCNGNFFDINHDYLQNVAQAGPGVACRFLDNFINLQDELSKKAEHLFGENIDVDWFNQRVTKATRAFRSVFSGFFNFKKVPATYVDLLCSYLNQFISQALTYQSEFLKIQQYPSLFEADTSHNKLQTTPAILLPSYQLLLALYNPADSKSTDNAKCTIDQRNFYMLGNVLVGTLMDPKINDRYIKYADESAGNIYCRSAYSPKRLCKVLDGCEQERYAELFDHARDLVNDVLVNCFDFISFYPSRRSSLEDVDNALDESEAEVKVDERFETISKLVGMAQKIRDALSVIKQDRSKVIAQDITFFDNVYHESKQLMKESLQGGFPIDDIDIADDKQPSCWFKPN